MLAEYLKGFGHVRLRTRREGKAIEYETKTKSNSKRLVAITLLGLRAIKMLTKKNATDTKKN